jgi:hypothetical protein
MKKVFIILSTLFLFGCGPIDKKQYRLEVTYTNGQQEILTFSGYGDNLFELKQGDLTSGNATLVSGVRDYKVLSIINGGPLTDKERENIGCGCGPVKLTSKEKVE